MMEKEKLLKKIDRLPPLAQSVMLKKIVMDLCDLSDGKTARSLKIESIVSKAYDRAIDYW